MPVAQGREGVRQEMRKFAHGELHSGSPHGRIVTNPKQAIAISLSVSRRTRTPGKRRHTLREIRQHRRH
jgi:hypothetical protein